VAALLPNASSDTAGGAGAGGVALATRSDALAAVDPLASSSVPLAQRLPYTSCAQFCSSCDQAAPSMTPPDDGPTSYSNSPLSDFGSMTEID
jgi:hypothetical protein